MAEASIGTASFWEMTPKSNNGGAMIWKEPKSLSDHEEQRCPAYLHFSKLEAREVNFLVYLAVTLLHDGKVSASQLKLVCDCSPSEQMAQLRNQTAKGQKIIVGVDGGKKV